ncbi:hypothetical protein BS47DRAFT_1083994 [Hydnum rufescens UP504]|uniref:Transcription factor domain-containing protein n=1 Tax=Hydnum rufescens UP504 TaxID=1448309 RepID=A0A9P6DYP9_9AGAM|nr:hypothetical protein BS47DRAFT_1083994 [Hydnum rufescens UP504]
MSRGTNMIYSDPSVETYRYRSLPKATGHMSPFAHNMNFLPMASSPMGGSLVYNRFEDPGNDLQSHEDADKSELERFWTLTPDALVTHSYEMLNQPSVEFTRQMWWESLTRYYGGPRALATRRIMEDLSNLFRISNSFVACINVPLFLSTFHHPSQREHVQPSLVLAMLALSTLLQSSEIGFGQEGRLKALELRDLAQSHFDMSLNCGWVSPDLAQAALVLVVFEASCHPVHFESRVQSALFLLDSLISGLGLLHLDKEEYNVTTFSPNTVPSLLAPFSDPIGQAAIGQGATKRGCSCSRFQLSSTSPSSRKITPLWFTSPGWSEEWGVAETRREEQRRLIWNTLTVTSGHLSYYDFVDRTSQNFSIAKPWNCSSRVRDSLDLRRCKMTWPRNTPYGRFTRGAIMLYTSCLSVHDDASMSEYDKGQFALQAWLESERIEKMLNSHTCHIERVNLYFGRQILFDTRNLVSSQYSRYVPHPNIGDPHFHRDKAMSWLNHQKNVAHQFLGALSHVTGLRNTLATRPYLTFWFHDQLARYLDTWRQDPTLRIALDLCVQLLPPAEYIMALFPSNDPREKYEILHQRLVDACILSGIPAPPPPNYIL